MLMVIFEAIFYLILAVILYYLVLYITHVWDLRNYPAGPFPLPVIGNLHLIDPNKLFQIFSELGKIYGDVYSISFGMQRLVIVNTIEPSREVLVEKAGEFSGRPTDNYIFNMISRNGADLVLGDYGSEWHGKKMLASKALKIFSDHNSSLEEKITMEARKCSKRLANYSTTQIKFESEFKLATCSLICSIVFGESYNSLDDEGFQTILGAMEHSREAVCNDITSIFPWLKHFPILAVRMMEKCMEELDVFLSRRYNERCQTLDPNNPRDFMSWLIMASKDEKMLKHYGLKKLTRDNMEMISSDIILGALDTTTAVFLWTILHFLHYPEYVEDALCEIRYAVGVKKYPAIKDKSSLPKTQAIIQECLRIAASPVILPHNATQDSSIAGNPIRKGTQVLFNVWNMHRDERHWENPLEFKPYRWLDDNGKFNPHKHKSYLPFLLGERACIGEQIARSELFLILTRIIVDFKIDKDPNQRLPKLTEGIFGFAYYPKPFNAVLTRR